LIDKVGGFGVCTILQMQFVDSVIVGVEIITQINVMEIEV